MLLEPAFSASRQMTFGSSATNGKRPQLQTKLPQPEKRLSKARKFLGRVRKSNALIEFFIYDDSAPKLANGVTSGLILRVFYADFFR